MDKPTSLQTVFEAAETLSTEDRDLFAILDSNPSVGAKTNSRVQAFQEWVETHRALTLPTLSEESMSRESIYGERG